MKTFNKSMQTRIISPVLKLSGLGYRESLVCGL